MKNIAATFFSTFLCMLLVQAEPETHITKERDISVHSSPESIAETINVHTEIIDQLAPLRAHVAQQVEQIKNILTTLRETVHTSKLQDKEQLCRELGLVCDCMTTLAQTIPDMNKQALTNLIELNTVVLNQLQTQLANGNISGLCTFTAVQFTTPQEQIRTLITIEQLQEKITILQKQIHDVWLLTTSISLADYAETAQKTSHSLWQKIKNNKNTFIASLGAICAAAYIYKNNDTINTSAWIERCMGYSLMALYILRQKKDADITPLAYNWFGKESVLAHAMISAKQFIGSPKEKLPAVQIIARHDMSAKEQIKWAEDQNCAVLKTEKGRDSNFIKNFFDLEDGLFKLPVSFFFAYRIKEDMSDIAKFLDAGANGFFKRLADLINGKK